MAAYKARLKEFENVLNCEIIDIKKLRKLCFNGCPFESGYRSICWKILLNFLTVKKSEWKESLTKQRALYRQFIEEMILDPGKKANSGAQEDHPLNPSPDSQWQVIFKDNEMLMQIDKDCRRLCPDLFFFQRATEFPCEELVNDTTNVETLRKRVEQCVLRSETVARNRVGMTGMVSSRRKASDAYMVLAKGEEAHWEVVERILFIYAKLNPGLKYVQGMNEILGPIYYTFAVDPDSTCREFAEADSFFCFTNLMAEIRDNFIKTLDESQFGIGYIMNELYRELQERDPALWHLLKEQDLKPQYYAFRWLTLLLSQEFPLPDVLRIWDSLFSDEHRFDFLIKIAVAMLVLIRDDLLQGDFPHNMKLVQNFPYARIEVQKVIAKAVEMIHR
ncbi:TBC1 domain family member 13-like [Gigantopelta aegis]|uniref:TBC1 domain family member 13-like n=1 Tax=Gigantopelta aegis TaxID=1735272 RepID=UPI001B889BA0|nr:TBC1 domain family member 13-like [Gigantopelta aegis]